MLVDNVHDYQAAFSKWWVQEWKTVTFPEKVRLKTTLCSDWTTQAFILKLLARPNCRIALIRLFNTSEAAQQKYLPIKLFRLDWPETICCPMRCVDSISFLWVELVSWQVETMVRV